MLFGKGFHLKSVLNVGHDMIFFFFFSATLSPHIKSDVDSNKKIKTQELTGTQSGDS